MPAGECPALVYAARDDNTSRLSAGYIDHKASTPGLRRALVCVPDSLDLQRNLQDVLASQRTESAQMGLRTRSTAGLPSGYILSCSDV